MLNEKEIERFELLEKELHQLRSEVKIQNLVISGFLNAYFTNKKHDHSLFYSAVRSELNKLPTGSDTQHLFMDSIQEWVSRYDRDKN